MIAPDVPVGPRPFSAQSTPGGTAGWDGEDFRRVIPWSPAQPAGTALLISLRSTPVLGWMVPGRPEEGG